MDSRDKKGRQGQYRDKQGKTAIVMARSRKTKSSIIPHCPCLFPAWFVPFFCCSAVVPSCSCVFPVMYFLALFLFYLWFLGAASLPLTIPSTRNLFFLLHGVFNNVRMMFCGTDFLLNFPFPGIISFLDMDNAFSSIQQAASISLNIFYHLSLNWRLIFYPFHWNFDRSLNTALSCYVQQADCLLRLSLYHWFFFMLIIMMISNNTCKFLWSCHPWR